MRRFLGVPLAWLNLTHHKGRFALFAAGIGFAVVLMFMQFGFLNALLDSSVLLIEHLNADLVLVSKQHTTLVIREPFSRRRLAQAGSVPGVASVHPLYVEYYLSVMGSTLPQEKRAQRQSIRVLGVEPDAQLLTSPALAPAGPGSRVVQLKGFGSALYDRRSKPFFGPLAPGLETELAGERIKLAGTFALGTDFGAKGTLIVSDETFAALLRRPYYRGSPFEEVELGLIRLHSGANRRDVQRALNALFCGTEVEVLTLKQMETREHRFWSRNTPVGYVFTLGMIMGFLVGLVICLQILFSDIADHQAEYATLKAIGYSSRFLAGVVLQEAWILGLAGFVPGLALSWLLYQGVAWVTDLPLRLTWYRIGLILGLTLLMCSSSGLLAVRKAQQADPAEVF